ncbi:MAG: hypothetical protein LUI02_01840 [Clostridiales bacterium]|nr:hypothetical protein [Clostridiales bacterium]
MRELEDRHWETTGLTMGKADKVLDDFWNTINNPNKVSENLLFERNVMTYNVGDDVVIAIEVPAAQRSQKPIYINGDIFGGTFRRTHTGDYRCTKQQVKAMLRDQTDNTMDMEILSGVPMADLNYETIAGYRNRHRTLKSGHPFERLPDDEYLRSIGAAAISDEDGQLHPTGAGMLMFGDEFNIVRQFPEYFLDYREVLDSSTRWTDRIQSSSGDWSGNVCDFYFRVYNKIIQDIKVPFQMEGGDRIDDTPVHRALREALANCLVNADFYGVRGVVVRKEPNKLVFENPGSIRTGKKQMRRGGESDPRNKGLMKMFNLINIGERSGSGVPNIFDVWRDEGWTEPVIEEQFDPDRTVVTLSFDVRKIVPEKSATKEVPEKSDGKKLAEKSGEKLADHGNGTNAVDMKSGGKILASKSGRKTVANKTSAHREKIMGGCMENNTITDKEIGMIRRNRILPIISFTALVMMFVVAFVYLAVSCIHDVFFVTTGNILDESPLSFSVMGVLVLICAALVVVDVIPVAISIRRGTWYAVMDKVLGITVDENAQGYAVEETFAARHPGESLAMNVAQARRSSAHLALQMSRARNDKRREARAKKSEAAGSIMMGIGVFSAFYTVYKEAGEAADILGMKKTNPVAIFLPIAAVMLAVECVVGFVPSFISTMGTYDETESAITVSIAKLKNSFSGISSHANGDEPSRVALNNINTIGYDLTLYLDGSDSSVHIIMDGDGNITGLMCNVDVDINITPEENLACVSDILSQIYGCLLTSEVNIDDGVLGALTLPDEFREQFMEGAYDEECEYKTDYDHYYRYTCVNYGEDSCHAYVTLTWEN